MSSKTFTIQVIIQWCSLAFALCYGWYWFRYWNGLQQMVGWLSKSLGQSQLITHKRSEISLLISGLQCPFPDDYGFSSTTTPFANMTTARIKSVQNTPGNPILTWPCNRTRLDSNSKSIYISMWTQGLILNWPEINLVTRMNTYSADKLLSTWKHRGQQTCIRTIKYFSDYQQALMLPPVNSYRCSYNSSTHNQELHQIWRTHAMVKGLL